MRRYSYVLGNSKRKNDNKNKHKHPKAHDEEELDLDNFQIENIAEEDDYTVNEYYLYNDISIKTVQGLLKFIKNAEKRWKLFLLETADIVEKAEPKPLKIFINSNGGDVFAAIPIIDAITNSSIPIHTYIEGMAASAASLISMVGHKRFITKNSFMLIHELRTGVEGTYSDIMDEKENCDKLMSVIKNIYLDKTNGKLENNIMEKILKRDIILSAEECLNYGLVDEVK